MKKIIYIVREYAAMFAEKGEKATRKAWEKAKKANYIETITVNLCLESLFARGDMTFIEALFAEEDIAKFFDYQHRRTFLPENYWRLKGKQYKKWSKVEVAEHELASWWAFHNLPFLQDILDKVTEDMLESQDYLSNAKLICDTFLEEVRDTLGKDYTPTFFDMLVDELVYMFTDELDIEDYGYDRDGVEAEVWQEFCQDSYGLHDVLEIVYEDFVCEVAREMLNYCV